MSGVLLLSLSVVACGMASGSPHQKHQYPRVMRLADAVTPSIRRLATATEVVVPWYGPPCPAAPHLPPSPLQPSFNVTQRLNALVTALDEFFVANNATGGAAVLVYNDSILFQHHFGSTRADGTGVPVAGDTSFRLASNTKVFTDVMLFHLRDAGKVSLDDQVWEPLLAACTTLK